LDQTSKTKLALLVKQLDVIVDDALAEMDTKEVDYILTNFSKYLNYDLKRNFETMREKNLKESPFDAIINDDLDLDKNL
jgi:hypothetical protein